MGIFMGRIVPRIVVCAMVFGCSLAFPAVAGATPAPSAVLSLTGPVTVVAGASYTEAAHVVVSNDMVNVAEVDLRYKFASADFLSSDTIGSPMGLVLFNGGGGGETMVVSGVTGSSLTGDLLISNTQFRASCTPGSSSITYGPSTGVISTVTSTYTPMTLVPKTVKVVAAPSGSICASPSLAGQAGTSKKIAIYGSGFSAGTTVSFGAGITTKSVAVLSSTRLNATIDTSSAAVVGTRNITVTRANGSSKTCTACFTVDTKPVPTSLDVSTLARGASVTTSLRAAGVVHGVTVSVAGGGVTATVTGVIPGRADLTLTATASAAAGPRTLTVTNPDGGSGACTNCLTVS